MKHSRLPSVSAAREADSDFHSRTPGYRRACHGHLDAAHTRKASKRQSRKHRKRLFAYFHFTLAVYRRGTGNAKTATLHQKIGKSSRQTGRSKGSSPEAEETCKERTFGETTGKAKTVYALKNRKSRYPAAKPTVTRYPTRAGSGYFCSQQNP